LREFERERQEGRYREQLAGLTAREEEILKLLATGDSNREIGKRLFISEQTVKNHVASIFRKLQVNARTKAALLAVKLGLGGRGPSGASARGPRSACSSSSPGSRSRSRARSPFAARTGRCT